MIINGCIFFPNGTALFRTHFHVSLHFSRLPLSKKNMIYRQSGSTYTTITICFDVVSHNDRKLYCQSDFHNIFFAFLYLFSSLFPFLFVRVFFIFFHSLSLFFLSFFFNDVPFFLFFFKIGSQNQTPKTERSFLNYS